MVRCNLAVLLAERNLKITQVSKDTGVSRTTLTSLSSNDSQGIQFDTLNTLCSYLKITPEKLLSYISSDFFVSSVVVNRSEVTVSFDIKEISINYSAKLEGSLLIFENDNYSLMFDLIPYDTLDKMAINLITLLRKIPQPFLSDLEAEIKRKLSIETTTFRSINISWNFDTV